MREIAIAAALTASTCMGAALAQTAPLPAATTTAQRPNILLIVADDLGWSDLGAFGGNIDTPNLDKLALAGVRFTGFHTAPTCSPTRSMLMSGVDNHEAGLGTMAEMLSPNETGHPGYEGYLNDRVASIAELMQQGGYHTLMAGKWHLGLTEDRSPAARGFDRSFALLQGLGNHFGADQNAAWADVEQAKYRQDRKEVPFPKGAYSTDLFADKLIGFLGEPASTQKPFFAYLAFSAPHWPLQAPDADIAKYKGRFDAGPEALRAARLDRQKQLGLVPTTVVAHPLVGVPAWSSLTPEQRAIEARKMEVYAAMVDRLDRNVGRVIDALRASGQLDNTLILFTADNGPEGNEIAAPKQVTDPAAIRKLGIDNSLGNIGRGNSYVGYGFAWAQAGSAPSWLVKGYTTEGGTRTVTFASGKGVAGNGVAGGRVSSALLHVTDIAPTVLAEAGLEQPATYKGRAILPFEGRDLSQLLAGKADAVRTPDDLTAWELFDGRAIRQGDWKAIYLAPAGSRYLKQRGDGKWQLFDLSKDPGETTDLAAREPARLAALTAGWNRYAAAKGVVPPAAPAAPTVQKSPAP